MSIFEITAHIVSAPFGFICLLALSKWKYSRKATLRAATAFFIAICIIDSFFVVSLTPFTLQYPLIDFFYRITNMLLVLIFASILTRMQAVQMIFSALTTCVVVFIIDTLAITLRILFRAYPFEFIFELLVYPLIVFSVVSLRKLFLEVIEYMNRRLLPLCGISLFLLVCIFWQISIPLPLEQAPQNIPFALLICGVAIAMYAMELFLFRTLRIQSELEYNIRAMELNTTALEHQNSIAAQNAKKAALFRHDLRHTGQMLLACLNSGDIEEARKLIYSMDSDVRMSGVSSIISEVTGHKLLDATLSYCVDFAKESGIDISVDMSPMDDVEADKTELAVILSNALENATNACLKLPDGKPRIIRVDGRKRGAQYFLEIANTCLSGDLVFDPDTHLPVNNEKGHGLGSQSIAYFAQKHGAQLDYSFRNDWFYLRILFGTHIVAV